MDNLADILANKDFDQPTEITVIKRYVREHFNADVSVVSSNEQFVIVAPSSSLINTLRLHQRDLQRAIDTKVSLRFKIG